MTSMNFGTQRDDKMIRSVPLVALESAISPQTLAFAQRVQAFTNRPSPASLPAGSKSGSSEKSLQEHLFDALAEVKIMTAQIAMHLDIKWRDRLFHQLDALHDPTEWGDGEQPIQKSSFSGFIKAMLSMNPQRRPGLGLSDTGNLIAAWTTGRDKLTIEFLPSERVRWVLSRLRDGEMERFAGETSVARLEEGLMSHSPEHWFSYVTENYQPT